MKNWLDDLIGIIDPIIALKRSRARVQLAQMRKYEAASTASRTSGWVSAKTGTSANAEIGPALDLIRTRSRDLVRNNPYGQRAVSVIETNVVGTGILGQAKSLSKAARFVRTIEIWKDWCESTNCDYDGLNNFYGLQALAMRSVCEGGEVLLVRKWIKNKGDYGLTVPFQIQVLEGDYIDTQKNGPNESGSGFIINGVEFDKSGRRIAYWLFDSHPGEVLASVRTGSLKSVRTSTDDIKPLYRVDRAGQVRGMPWGAASILRLRDFDDYEDAQLMRQKIAACFAGFVGDIESPSDNLTPKDKFSDELHPGAVEILPPGKTITFPNVPQVQDDGHAMRVLRGIAAGFGVTYESISGDLSNVNFSSGRMGWIEMQRNIQKWQWLMFIPRFCNPVFEWFKQAAELEGYAVDGMRSVWTPPKREMIDPTKEIPAKIAEIRGGLTTLSEAQRENGYIPEELLLEMKQDNEILDQYELKLDSDPRNIARSGNVQQPGGTVDDTQNQSA